MFYGLAIIVSPYVIGLGCLRNTNYKLENWHYCNFPVLGWSNPPAQLVFTAYKLVVAVLVGGVIKWWDGVGEFIMRISNAPCWN